MRAIKSHLLACLLFVTTNAFASEKQVYDIASFDSPVAWTQQNGEGFLSYSKTEGENWCQIAIYQHRTSAGDIQADFDKDWKDLVANSRKISNAEKAKPESAGGWTVMSGSGVWQYKGSNVATILTVYSNSKICLSVLCNATTLSYFKDYQALLASMTLDASKVTSTNSPDVKSASLVGLWDDYITESNGTSTNGFPQLTAGYFRREYLFKADGTYVFRAKDWSVYTKDILFLYETGTWKIGGNQLTLTPKSGRGQWWGKAASGSTKGWGSLDKASEYKPQTVTYSFELKYRDDVKEIHLVLYNPKRTSRDRGTSGSTGMNRWDYRSRPIDQSLIDNPPGFKVPTVSTSSSEGTTEARLRRSLRVLRLSIMLACSLPA
ncbi:MAG: hypothetical protein GC165_10860 [Armatimonadetes bacterium]|nr:hypothetical protein [Armatimonadota bacterium]